MNSQLAKTRSILYGRRAGPIACLAWSSAPRHLGSRDRFIGWSQEARRRNIRFIAYNTRFLILPWVCIENLASHILGRMVARIKRFKNHTVQASQFLQKLAKEGVDLFVHWRIVVAGTFA